MYSNLGQTDNLDFQKKYKVIRYKYISLRALPRWVTQYIIKLGRVLEQFEKEGRTDLIDEVQREVSKANDDLSKAWKVKQAIDTWAGTWAAEKQVPASALSALTWVVNHGMAVHQEYNTKRNISEAAIKKAIEEDKDIEVPTFKEAIIGNVQYAIYGVIALIAVMAFSVARKI